MGKTQAEALFDNCVFDACNLQNYDDTVCRHGQSMARICTDQYNLKISWRTTTFCRKTSILYFKEFCEKPGLGGENKK